MVVSGEREEGTGKTRVGDKEVQTIRYNIGMLCTAWEQSQYFVITVNGV